MLAGIFPEEGEEYLGAGAAPEEGVADAKLPEVVEEAEMQRKGVNCCAGGGGGLVGGGHGGCVWGDVELYKDGEMLLRGGAFELMQVSMKRHIIGFMLVASIYPVWGCSHRSVRHQQILP